ncbi:MAG: efflux RND transporter permease subunit, partial [Gammaproteobacteria bacterium]
MISYFARHPTAANLLMLSLMLLGLITLPKLQRDTFPVIPPDEVEVRIPYPGATPQDVADDICLSVEDSLDAIADLKELRCDARENLAIVTARKEEFADMDDFFGEVKTAIDGISGFPDKVESHSVQVLERVATLAGVMITGPMSPVDLKAYADKVKERIKRDRRIAQVRVLGFSDRDIVIEVPAEAQQRYGVGISALRAAIEAQSLDLPAGVMTTEQGDLVVRFADQRVSASQFKDLVVLSDESGGWVKLGDIARVRMVFDQPEEKILFNGQRAAQLQVSKTINQDSLRVMEALKENLKRERDMAPPGVELTIAQDSTANIRDRLRIVLVNGVQGLGFVFLLMWLFFSLRFSFWVAMGLPVSFLGAVFFMHLFGYTLNMMTLVALLVAIGLLMDDAIVIAENISAQLRKGRDALTAAVEGTKQVLPGVFSSFITTIMIVGPLAFLSGKMGAVLKYIPAVLVIALAVSLIEAFLILPAHLRHSMESLKSGRRSAFHCRFDALFEAVRERLFIPLLKTSLRQPYLLLGMVTLFVAASVATLPAGLLKYRAMPTLESDVIEARVLLPQGTPLSRTEQVVDRLTESLKAVNARFTPLQNGGAALVRGVSVRFNDNADAFESGPHLATVSADLIRAESRVGDLTDILATWREATGEVADVVSLKFTDKERGIAGKAIDIRLLGGKPEMLSAAAEELKGWLSRFDGVLEVSDDLRPGKPEFRVSLRESAGVLGVTAKNIADELRNAIHGATALEIQRAGEAVDVV